MQMVGCMDECREKKKQKKISDLLVDVARDVDVLRAMLHGYAGADADGCGCGSMRMRMRMWYRCGWMWMWMWYRCGWDVDAVDVDE